MEAVGVRDADMARLLMHAGADPSIRNRDGETAVDMARHSRSLQVLGVLSGEAE